jgi:acetolactate synthase I/II/III large subunit
VLAVGTALGESMQYLLPPAWAGPDRQRVVHLDADPGQIGVNRATDVALVGDAKAGLAAVLTQLRARGAPRPMSDAAAAYAREYADFRRLLIDGYANIDTTPIHPGRLAVEVARFLPEDAILALDGGDTGLWAHLATTHRRPRSFVWTGHYGHLGTGLPYAMGAKLANPDRPVVLFTGDGAFGFNLQELETAAREAIPIVVVVNCDGAWGMETVYMHKTAGTTIGVGLSDVRYDEVARALGCHGEMVDDSKELRGALDRAVAAGVPAVVHVAVDAAQNTNPPGLDDFAAMYDAANT